MKRKIVIFVLLAAISSFSTLAQDSSCPEIVQSALESAEDNCVTLNGNQVCYGNTFVEAEIQSIDVLPFENPGDIVEIVNLRSLRLSSMDTANGAWGIVLIEVPTDSTNSTTSEDNATYVFFGDVGIENVAARLPLSLLNAADVYENPDSAAPVLASLSAGESLSAISRSEDNLWLEVELADAQLGWLLAEHVNPDEALATLPVYNPDSSEFAPMQAFYFSSGVNDAPCDAAPESGILLQTPEGNASVTIWVDGIYIDIDGTAFVQASPDDGMTVNVVEGDVVVESLGVTQSVSEGMQTTVEIDENLNAISEPSDPAAIDPEDLENLPLDLLGQPVDIPTAANQILPLAGIWRFAWDSPNQQCPDGTIITLDALAPEQSLSLDAAAASISVLGVSHYPTGNNSYSAIYTDMAGTIYQYNLTIVSETSITGIAEIELPSCTVNASFSLNFQN